VNPQVLAHVGVDVKNPPSWPPPRLADVPSFVKVKEGNLLALQVITFGPPLLTMR